MVKRMVGQWTQRQLDADVALGERALREVICARTTPFIDVLRTVHDERTAQRVAAACSVALAYAAKYGSRPFRRIVAWDDQTMEVTW